MQHYYKTPGGQYSSLYADMAKQPHLLIAGATGSGKSVVINGIIHALLVNNTPNSCGLILIDPKRVELVQYKQLPHVLMYASEPGEPARALRAAIQVIESRYAEMQAAGLRKYSGGDVYVIIDELADLMTTDRKAVQPLLQRIAQIGRAAKVHVIAATQCPLATVIPTAIKVNFDSRVGLRCRSSQDSRNILGQSCCEDLPRYGQGYYMTPEGLDRWQLPMIDDAELNRVIRHWTTPSECITTVA